MAEVPPTKRNKIPAKQYVHAPLFDRPVPRASSSGTSTPPPPPPPPLLPADPVTPVANPGQVLSRSADGEPPGAPTKVVYQCWECKSTLYQSTAFIEQLDVAASDFGEMTLVCLPCVQTYHDHKEQSTDRVDRPILDDQCLPLFQGRPELARWETVCKNQWRLRGTQLGVVARNYVRLRCYTDLVDQMKTAHPGLRGRALRDKLLEQMKSFAEHVTAAFEAASSVQKSQAVAAFARQERDLFRTAETGAPTQVYDNEHPDAVSTGVSGHVHRMDTGAIILGHRLADYLDKICEGVNQYFVCRHLDCQVITLSTLWLENGGQFACPICTRQYKGWTETGGRMDANKVFIVSQTSDPQDTMIRDPNTDEFQIIYTTWPDETTTNLVNELKSLQLELQEEVHRDARAREELHRQPGTEHLGTHGQGIRRDRHRSQRHLGREKAPLEVRPHPRDDPSAPRTVRAEYDTGDDLEGHLEDVRLLQGPGHQGRPRDAGPGVSHRHIRAIDDPPSRFADGVGIGPQYSDH